MLVGKIGNIIRCALLSFDILLFDGVGLCRIKKMTDFDIFAYWF